MSDSGAYHFEMLEIQQHKLSRNLNGHNFSLGFPIQAHNISRRSKLNNGCFREFQMVITFHSPVRFRRIAYRDAEIEQRKLSRNSNGHTISLACPIQAHNILTPSKLSNGFSREIQLVITFHSPVRFRRIAYRDARN